MQSHPIDSLRSMSLRVPVLRVLIVAAIAFAGLLGASGSASAAMSVTPLTWDLIGLDSNKPTTQGPDTFPIGVRVCNLAGSATNSVTATFSFTTSNSYISAQTGLVAARTLGVLAASGTTGDCKDAYWYATITRDSNAFYSTRPLRAAAQRTWSVTATDGSVSDTETGTLYVEKILSQNRNKIISVTGDTGATTPEPGSTHTYTLTAYTASSYSEVEAFLVFPAGVEVLSSPATFSRTDFGGLASTNGPWADGCQSWSYVYSPIPGNANCPGPGKQGNTVVVTYTVTFPNTPVAAFWLKGLIYDFSGSSFHYNSDFGGKSLRITPGVPMAVAVTGDGEVTSVGGVGADPGDISCGTTGTQCRATYASGTVTLTATPGAGQTFVGWGGACSGASTTCTVTMGQTRNATAVFTGTTSVPLDTQVVGDGTVGTPSKSIECTESVTNKCAKTFLQNSKVKLTASPSVGWAFAEWSGACAGQGLVCEVDLPNAQSVVATFVPGYRLTASPIPTGGTVSDADRLVDCGDAATTLCAASYPTDTEVTLTATPKAGYRFVRWSGDCASSTTTTCTLVMDQDHTASVVFESTATTATTTTRNTSPQLKLTVTSSRARTRAGQTVDVKLVLRNVGTSTANKPRTCLVIPSGFTLVAPVANYANGKVCFSATKLKQQKSLSYLVTLRATDNGTRNVRFSGTARASNAKRAVDTADTHLVPLSGDGQSAEQPTG